MPKTVQFTDALKRSREQSNVHGTFGTKFATVNLSLLYTAKGASAFLVPVANLIKSATGGWHLVFVLTAIMNFVVVGLALFVLKPLFLANG